MKRGLWIHGPTVVWALLIFILSSIPSLKTPEVGISMQDKLAHVIEFGVLGFFLQKSLNHIYGSSSRIYLFVFLIGSAYAGLDEIHQSFVDGREAEVSDFIANSVGIVLSQSIFWMVSRFRLS